MAYRMLGSRNEADDAVQDAWMKLNRADASEIDNLAGWLTTVVARVCLDMLRARKVRHEANIELDPPHARDGDNPEEDALMGRSVGLALMVVMEALGPAERVAFVLHDMFDLPFDEIAGIIGRSEAATRQLASRARRRVQGAPPVSEQDIKRQREVVDAFLAAARGGDMATLVALLDPAVVTRADDTAVEGAKARQHLGAPVLAKEAHGVQAVADMFKGRAQAAQPVLINGAVGAAWVAGGQVRSVFSFTIEDGKILEIEIVANMERINRFDVKLLEEG